MIISIHNPMPGTNAPDWVFDYPKTFSLNFAFNEDGFISTIDIGFIEKGVGSMHTAIRGLNINPFNIRIGRSKREED